MRQIPDAHESAPGREPGIHHRPYMRSEEVSVESSTSSVVVMVRPFAGGTRSSLNGDLRWEPPP